MDMENEMGIAIKVEKDTDFIRQSVQTRLLMGTITLGDAVRRLRTEVSKLSQDDFAKLCKISRRTLGQVELDRGNPTMQTINLILEYFDLAICIRPRYRVSNRPTSPAPGSR
ncbi:helix-turn-helix transcriptional regulator [Pseudomonas frederiksbergensis]|jgi:DNA-binding XRE family transcriptional regulator|uniref:helix-turn-helix transcriptional regulator n=1 Tax=Pseudomonas frederiksbergensis TaxID=104087 RepID=UPI003D231852